MHEKILIADPGARGHAIGWKIGQHSLGEREIHFAPGNGGTSDIGVNTNFDPHDLEKTVRYAVDNKITFVVVGSERLLANGLTDALEEEGVSAFGHSKDAMFLEADKAEATLFMERHNIPHPHSQIFTYIGEALAFVEFTDPSKMVIKASGLAEGKGVVLPDTIHDAREAILDMMVYKKFEDAGSKVVIQERLIGKEASIIGFVSNEIGLLVPARDYKRANNGDTGLNTGGMGGYAPNDYLTPELLHEVKDTILIPTMNGMKDEGTPLKGALYAGIIMTETGPKVIEYNLRFGDPETQLQVRLLESDLLESMKATREGRLNPAHYRSSSDVAVGVVLASNGYPGLYSTGKEIKGISKSMPKDIVVFHAGTKQHGDDLKSDGGRVLTVTSTGATKEEARKKVYDVMGTNGISMDDGYFREDIGL